MEGRDTNTFSLNWQRDCRKPGSSKHRLGAYSDISLGGGDVSKSGVLGGLVDLGEINLGSEMPKIWKIKHSFSPFLLPFFQLLGGGGTGGRRDTRPEKIWRGGGGLFFTPLP